MEHSGPARGQAGGIHLLAPPRRAPAGPAPETSVPSTMAHAGRGAGTMNKVPIEQLQDVWMRMTPRLRELVCTPDGLLGQRIGIAADFPPHPDLCLTDLHKRALEACEKHAVAYPFKGTIKAKLDPSWMCSVIGAESLAAKEAAKPARWSAYDDAGGSGWWVGEN